MSKYKLVYDGILNILDENYEAVPFNQTITYNSNDEKEVRLDFRDRTIFREANVKVEIFSNEVTRHSLPHVHITIDKEFEFSVGISEIKILASGKNTRLEKAAIQIAKDNIELFRSEWNKMSSLLKFQLDSDGKVTENLIKNS